VPGRSPEATALVSALAAALIAGYFIGGQLNRRRARDLANWLRAALRTLGGEPAFSRLGAVGFTASIAPAKGPIRRLNAAVILLPREVPPFWLARALTGTPDLLTLRIALARAPRFAGDLLDPATPFGRRAGRQVASGWARRRVDGLVAAAPDQAALDRLAAVAAAAREAGLQAQILSLRRAEPHLLITLRAPDSEAASRQILGGAQTLAGRVGDVRVAGSRH
jgi:hypothetical protein